MNRVVHQREVLLISLLFVGGQPINFGTSRFHEDTILFHTREPRGAEHLNIRALLSFAS
jgi:hypothetical protein